MGKGPIVELSVVVLFSDVFGYTPTLEGARSLLAAFDRDSVLLLLAKLSSTLQLWFRPDYDRDNALALQIFRGASSVFENRLPGNPRRLFFTRLGVLATARLALTACDRSGAAKVQSPKQASQILTCCLMMNELAAESKSESTDLVVRHLPNHSARAHYDFRIDLVRSLAIFERNRELLEERQGLIDLAQEFRAATGLSPTEFVDLCLFTAVPYRLMPLSSLVDDDPRFFIDENSALDTKISVEAIRRFFRAVARTSEELVEFLPTQGSRPLCDATVFQTWPFIRLQEGRYYCLDVASLMDKTGRGLYWTLFSRADSAVKQRLGGTYGAAFERYVHDRIRATGITEERYISNPKFSNGDEVCDGLFLEGTCAVVCEYKSSVLRADAKLSGQLEKLEPELNKKFITGDGDGRKGVAQLEKTISRLLIGETIIGTHQRKWKTILPVMVCLENAMTCAGMSKYLNDRFDREALKGVRNAKIGPLMIIDIENFEDLLPDIRQHGFFPLLDDYYCTYFRGPRDQIVELRRRYIPLLATTPNSSAESNDEFKAFFGDLVKRVFINDPSSQEQA